MRASNRRRGKINKIRQTTPWTAEYLDNFTFLPLSFSLSAWHTRNYHKSYFSLIPTRKMVRNLCNCLLIVLVFFSHFDSFFPGPVACCHRKSGGKWFPNNECTNFQRKLFRKQKKKTKHFKIFTVIFEAKWSMSRVIFVRYLSNWSWIWRRFLINMLNLVSISYWNRTWTILLEIFWRKIKTLITNW